ncbi:MAG TPA: hypothetical protein VKR61_26535 [Bryobacteraceae bacterium]|nr:hypothetical protein [Bryobacteraceae bacterium]
MQTREEFGATGIGAAGFVVVFGAKGEQGAAVGLRHQLHARGFEPMLPDDQGDTVPQFGFSLTPIAIDGLAGSPDMDYGAAAVAAHGELRDAAGLMVFVGPGSA